MICLLIIWIFYGDASIIFKNDYHGDVVPGMTDDIEVFLEATEIISGIGINYACEYLI